MGGGAERPDGDVRQGQVDTGIVNQILFVDYMLSGYSEPTGQRMLRAVRESLERLAAIEGGRADGGGVQQK